MTARRSSLESLGDALELAAARDLAARPGAPRRPRRRFSRRLVVGLVSAAVAIPALAVAAGQLVDEGTVADSLPAGTRALIGTDPSCTVVREDVEYHCTLARAPSTEGAPLDWTGTVEPTVDATSHVNGGCRALRADGREWRCYIGEAAVTQKIIGPDFLGERSLGPGSG